MGERLPLIRCPVAGRVFTYTVNYQPFNPAVPVPYVIAIVELAEQADLRIAANIVDCEPDSVHVGMPVEVRFERHDVDDGSVFVPVFAPQLRGGPREIEFGSESPSRGLLESHFAAVGDRGPDSGGDSRLTSTS